MKRATRSPTTISLLRFGALTTLALAGACGGTLDGSEQTAAFGGSLPCSTIQPTGLARQRWDQTGGLDGPLGCPVGATQAAPGGAHGQVTPFQNGQIVTSPDQGSNMTVAVYQQGADLYVEWGDSAPFSYDRFLVRWDVNGTNDGQVDVPMAFPPVNPPIYVLPHEPRTRGVFAIPVPRAGSYSVTVEGCDNGSTSSTCRQGWTVPATITYVPPPPPSVGSDCNSLPPPGPILSRWKALGGMFGPLGCPISAPASPPGGGAGQVQTFRNGQIGWAPSQGTNLTVAAYQAESDVVVEWGETSPFHYDKFNVRWSKDGQLITQNELQQPAADHGLFTHGIDHVRGLGPGVYTVAVEGCDGGALGSTCRQGFTFPVTVNLTARGSYAASCSTVPSGVIGERWSHLLGPEGPLLGCPVGSQQTVGHGASQTFERGQIVWSPDQGADLTVAMYQKGSQLLLTWGDTFPFSYDKFIVRINGSQVDVTQDGASHLTSLSAWYPYSPTAPPLTVGTTYTAVVEGCDVSLGNSTCRQGWTIPVSVTFAAPPAHLPDENPPIVFTGLTPATSPADAPTELQARGLAISKYNGCIKTLGDVFKDEQDFANGALAKLDLVARGQVWCNEAPHTRPLPIRDEVNAALRFQQVKSKSGSTADKVYCTRTGEYDVALTGYVAMAYRYGAQLDNDVRAHIVNDLLNVRGPVPYSDFGYCSVVDETENHVNQIESARYLTNQLLYAASGNQTYNNETNGMNDYMLDRLRAFTTHDFIEYNSKPYQTYTVNALQNLFDYATDRRVKKGAQLVLDYLAAKYSISSSSLRRNAPYRRRVSAYEEDLFGQHADPWNGHFTLLSGMFWEDAPPATTATFSFGYKVDLQMAAISSYRAPDPVMDMLMVPSRRSYFERIHHDGVEIYSATPDYLITAGGYWTGGPYTAFGAADSDDDGPVMATTLMPTGTGHSVKDLIRLEGFNYSAVDTRNRLNTCVAPDFACGINLRIPDPYRIPAQASCVVKEDSTVNPNGHWIFIDSASAGCQVDPSGGFYVAAFFEGAGDIETLLTTGDNRGFFEAHPLDPGLSFQQFQSGVKQRNATRVFAFDTTAPNPYTMTSGRTVQFEVPPQSANKYDWTIVSTGDPAIDALGTDITKWPLASGSALSSKGDGRIDFVDAGARTSMTLDFTDVGEPKRTVTAPPPVRPPHCPPGGCNPDPCPRGGHTCM